MPPNPKYEQFPWVKVAPKGEKSTDQLHKILISSEAGQDTSARQISGYYFHAFTRKPDLWPSQDHEDGTNSPEENQQTVTKIHSVLKVVKINQHGKFLAIPSMCFQENAWKHQIRPIFR